MREQKLLQMVLRSEYDKHTRQWTPAAAMSVPAQWKVQPAWAMVQQSSLHTMQVTEIRVIA